jgi:hypothetical protein
LVSVYPIYPWDPFVASVAYWASTFTAIRNCGCGTVVSFSGT